MRGGDRLHALIIIARKRKMGLSLTSHVKFHIVHSPLSVRLEWRMYDFVRIFTHCRKNTEQFFFTLWRVKVTSWSVIAFVILQKFCFIRSRISARSLNLVLTFH